MIEFKKIQGVPTDVTSGEDVIWFSGTAGAIYVADNEGHPIRMSAGSIQGAAIPVGTPAAPNTFYYCTTNKKHYISTETEWLQLGASGQAGSPSNSGAGRVTISDPGNFYTSTDVEGALYEIGSSIYYLLGDKELKPLLGNALGEKNTGDFALVPGATTNMPTTLSSWMSQRKGPNGKLFTIAVDEAGKLSAKNGNTWVHYVTENQLNTLGTVVEDLKNKKIEVGQGLTISQGGGILSNPKISIDEVIINNLINANAEAYVSKTLTNGDFMRGPLEVRKSGEALFLNGSAGAQSSYATLPVSLFHDGQKFEMREYVANGNSKSARAFYRYDKGSGVMLLNPNQRLDVDSKIALTDSENGGRYSLDVQSPLDNKIRYQSNYGYLQLSSPTTRNNFVSGSPQRGPREIGIIGPDNSVLPKVDVRTKVLESYGKIFAGSGMTIGRREGEDHSDVDFSGKLYLFPYKIDPSMNRGTADRYYTHLGYNQDDRTLEVRSFFRQAQYPSDQWEEKAVSIKATKFISTSSEKFKNVHSKLEEKYNSLDILRRVDSWLYDFKSDDKHKETSGFIIERGVPEFAIETGGESIDSYAMISVLWDAVKKLDRELQQLKAQG